MFSLHNNFKKLKHYKAFVLHKVKAYFSDEFNYKRGNRDETCLYR